MAVTIANVAHVIRGNERVRYVDITGPASYTTNGEALTAANIAALTDGDGWTISNILKFDAEVPVTGQSLSLDRTNSKIKYYNGTTEIAAAVNLSTVVTRCEVTYAPSNY